MTGQVSEDTPEVIIHSTGEDPTEIASFYVEIADTPAERSRGLMHRPDMASGWGMIFIYPNRAPRRFWMKNTLISLDMLFIRADKTIANIVHSAEPETRTGRHSDGAVKYVLEISGGEAKERGIKAGQTVEFVGVDSGRCHKPRSLFCPPLQCLRLRIGRCNWVCRGNSYDFSDSL
jgi:uncharacterized membrane protein (UPF0127 family)